MLTRLKLVEDVTLGVAWRVMARDLQLVVEELNYVAIFQSIGATLNGIILSSDNSEARILYLYVGC